jgi:ParB-like chromosome segregation protein Spo0J
MGKIDWLCMTPILVSASKVVANDYNPNKVAKPEMKLLKKSIEDNGFCFPIVTIYDKDNDNYIIIDGFHRYTVLTEYLKSKEIPIVVLEHDIKKRMAATIQFNRARGTHQIIDMSNIVSDLFAKGWDDDKICEHLGMELDEVIRLKQVSGLKSAFGDHEFSKSWNEYIETFAEEELQSE